MLLLHLGDLDLILGHESLLRRVCLVTKFLNDRFNLTISLLHHFFSDLTLSLNVLILCLLEQFALEFVMLNHQLLFDLLHFILMPSLHVLNSFLAKFLFLTDLVGTTCLDLFDFLFQTVILEFKHLLNA